jgi:hypothetical protein
LRCRERGSIFVSDYALICVFVIWIVASAKAADSEIVLCAKSAQKYARPEHAAHKGCQPAAHRRRMAKIITFQFRRSRLPRRLLNDGWWLASPRVRPSVIAFPKRDRPKPKTKVRHLTLITSGK